MLMMSFGARVCAVGREIPSFHHNDEVTKIIPATECSVFFLLSGLVHIQRVKLARVTSDSHQGAMEFFSIFNFRKDVMTRNNLANMFLSLSSICHSLAPHQDILVMKVLGSEPATEFLLHDVLSLSNHVSIASIKITTK